MTTESRSNAARSKSRNGSRPKHDQKLYEGSVLGFKNYWYPVFSSKSIGRKPVPLTIMTEKVVLMRTVSGEVKALADECAHRGTLLSIGDGAMLKGTDTITCPYHGWTYDLNDGMCVAVLPEGPDSGVTGKIRTRTYPIEERKGIVWIWMGKGEPVPVEDDIPNLMLREDTIVKFRPKVQYGNWRWHAENVVAGHAQMIHKGAFRSWFNRPRPMTMPAQPNVATDIDGTGVDNGFIPRGKAPAGAPKAKLPSMFTEYPGVGRWSPQPKWRQILLWPWLRRFKRSFGSEVQGVSKMMMMMPGVFRVPNFPSASNIYYEWYVPVDEEHYLYAQMACIWGTNPVQRSWNKLWYYVWGKPTGLTQFNNQDLKFTRQTTNYTQRHDTTSYPMAKISRNDDFHDVWRQFASELARDEGYSYEEGFNPEDSPLVGMVRSVPWLERDVAPAESEPTQREVPAPDTVPAGGSE